MVKFNDATEEATAKDLQSDMEQSNVTLTQLERKDNVHPPNSAPEIEETKQAGSRNVGEGLMQKISTTQRQEKSIRASMQSAGVAANGNANAPHQLTVGLMHEDEEEDHVPPYNMNFENQ